MKDLLTSFPEKKIEEIIREASKIMLEADSHRMHIEQKAGAANFVTEYDVKVQRFLQEQFSALVPGCSFLAEEEGESENPLGEGYTFVIDPIDGTTNFMFGRRASCICVGVFYNKERIYGAVYDPYTDRFFSAKAGQGAYCNGKKISVSEREPSFGIAYVGSAPYDREKLGRVVAEATYELLMRFADLRRIGSAALEICSVACGEADLYCEPILSPWDHAAAGLILTEAGGIMSDFHGEPLQYTERSSVIASTKTSYETALNVLKGMI